MEQIEKLKYYGIYQFFNNKQQKEKTLLLGVIEAENENDAVINFNNDKFKQGCLKAIECNELVFHTIKHHLKILNKNA